MSRIIHLFVEIEIENGEDLAPAEAALYAFEDALSAANYEIYDQGSMEEDKG